MEGNCHEGMMKQFCWLIEVLNPCMDDYLYIYNLKEDFYYISPGALERFRMPQNQFHNVTENLMKVVHPEDKKLLMDDLELMLNGTKDFHNLQYRWMGPEDEPIWIDCRGRVLKDEAGAPEYMVGCINEIGAKQKADNVSGLLGQSSLKTYMRNMQDRISEGFMLRIGIDNFKDINENKGIEYGDMILRKTAECIEASILPGQDLYRMVADEFVVVDFMGGSTRKAYRLYKKIRQKIDEFIEENHYEVVYTVSAGILNFNKIEDYSFSNIIKLSEFSLSEAKRNGKNRGYVFSRKDYKDFLRRKELIRIMRHSIYDGFYGFEVHFQPIVDAGSGELVSAETLLRFQTEEIGSVSPVEFIPILEETGLIIPVGKWVLHQAFSRCSEICKYIPDFRVSVNLSYVQVMKSNVLKEIILGIEKYRLNPSNIIIELTESGFLESDPNFTKFCDGLKERGIALALDDFGTGYSNLHYLYDLSPNIVKIDRSFTVKALQNGYEHNLLEHIIEMIHSIELTICVEGIETHEELQKINNLSPDFIQGFFFGRPCPYGVFYETYVKASEK